MVDPLAIAFAVTMGIAIILVVALSRARTQLEWHRNDTKRMLGQIDDRLRDVQDVVVIVAKYLESQSPKTEKRTRTARKKGRA